MLDPPSVLSRNPQAFYSEVQHQTWHKLSAKLLSGTSKPGEQSCSRTGLGPGVGTKRLDNEKYTTEEKKFLRNEE